MEDTTHHPALATWSRSWLWEGGSPHARAPQLDSVPEFDFLLLALPDLFLQTSRFRPIIIVALDLK
jgi:hypothetical protein